MQKLQFHEILKTTLAVLGFIYYLLKPLIKKKLSCFSKFSTSKLTKNYGFCTKSWWLHCFRIVQHKERYVLLHRIYVEKEYSHIPIDCFILSFIPKMLYEGTIFFPTDPTIHTIKSISYSYFFPEKVILLQNNCITIVLYTTYFQITQFAMKHTNCIIFCRL